MPGSGNTKLGKARADCGKTRTVRSWRAWSWQQPPATRLKDWLWDSNHGLEWCEPPVGKLAWATQRGVGHQKALNLPDSKICRNPEYHIKLLKSSIRPLFPKHYPDCPKKDDNIEPNGPVPNIPQIQSHLDLKGTVAST